MKILKLNMNQVKLFGVLVLIFVIGFASAQKVNVKKETARIKGENLNGHEVVLEAQEEAVVTYLSRFLKSAGKSKQSNGVYTLAESSLNGNAYTNPIYATTKHSGSTTSIWLGVKKEEWPDTDKINDELEKVVYNLGVGFYKDQIQQQIDESTRAMQAVEKQQQRLTNQGRDLSTKLDDNKRDKVRLEKALENNKLENESLLKKIDQNKHAQDSVAIAAEQIKKVVEAQKARQQKVN